MTRCKRISRKICDMDNSFFPVTEIEKTDVSVRGSVLRDLDHTELVMKITKAGPRMDLDFYTLAPRQSYVHTHKKHDADKSALKARWQIDRNIKHSRKRLEQLLEANFIPGKDYAITLSFREEVNRERVKELLNNFFDRVRRLRKKLLNKAERKLKYIYSINTDASFESQMNDLDQERAGLNAVVNRINDTNTYEFLSEEGLLPNYAFPEAGVNLKAILTRRTTKAKENGESETVFEKYTQEYSRAAASAITEFAPDNSFYANGHKMVIDQVDVSNDDEAERWRFCPDCNHMALDSTLNNVSSCPHCGSVGWADQGQVRTMRRVRTLYANMPYEASRTGDESDNRTIKYYSNQMLVDIDVNDVVCSYQTKEGTPFGFEYVKKATMREINFGESDNIGTRLAIAGKEEVRNGFMICKYCGKIQPRGQHAKPKHTSVCRAVTQSLKEPYEECMFLYRQFTSEAIRILMPSTTLDSSTKKMESFAAAIMLGLQIRFSNVDHLRFCVMDAPVPDAGFRKQYMVIFDSVPGGTGYLKQLVTTPDDLMQVFDLALHAMETCVCSFDDKKDGCYHCLYGYRQSNKINNISRKTAVELLRQILAARNSLEKNKSVVDIKIDNTNFDSELEKRFIEALSQSSTPGMPVTWTKTTVNGKEGYFFEIGECAWEIEPQVDYDGSMGNPVPSRPDFVMIPKTKGTKQRKVIVFTDGYTYHGNTVDVDTNKRLAIRDVFGLPVWSITWKDVQDRLASTPVPFASSALDSGSMPGVKDFERVLQKHHETDWRIKNLSSFDLLIRYLSDPQADIHFSHFAAALSLGMLEQKRSNQAEEFSAWNADYAIYSKLHESEDAPEYRKTVIGTWEPFENVRLSVATPIAKAKVMQTADGKKIPVFDENECSVLGYFDDTKTDDKDRYADSWRTYLYCMNMMQFAPKQVFVTRKGMDADLYSWYAKRHRYKMDTSIQIDPDWDEILTDMLYDPVCIELARTLRDKGKRAPDEVGMEAEDGSVLAEMVWTDDKIAVQLDCQIGFREKLISEGWTVFDVNDTAVIDAVKEV